VTLDEYLTGQFHTDKQDVRSIEEMILQACRTLAQTYTAGAGWPYRVSADGAPPEVSGSHSTTAMVTLSLKKALGDWRLKGARGSAARIKLSSLLKSDAEKIELAQMRSAAAGGEKLIRAIANELPEADVNPGKAAANPTTRSGTYGNDDPITLSFLAALVRDEGSSQGWTELLKYVQRRSSELSVLSPQTEFKDFFTFVDESAKNQAVPNALVPLRVVQAVSDAHSKGGPDLSTFRLYFETTLHDQLSYSSIPDSRFDPAELAFCLEGLLLAQPNIVDRALFDRVLEVLSGAQKNSAFWRPTKPFLATDRGMTLFPVSVEVANSLLRSCELFDQKSFRNTVGSASMGLFRRYWQWLSARKVTFEKELGKGKTKLVGWDSEHVNQIDMIHIWETSQVLEFLVSYHRMLCAHIARTSLALSRFNLRMPPSAGKEWDAIVKKYEPVSSLGESYSVYKRLGEDFEAGWNGPSDSSRNYSMLLYGPPGTGKTTIAENLADALGFALITITVSDFLADGGGLVEARAKAIFDVLEAQSDCVVLFDEIDAFLLDRDTARYAKQDTVFQFMTPGMLTKINDLRKAERIIFIVATNYGNRIDPAIKRTGRIDQKYLVLPYDREGRRRTIVGLSDPDVSVPDSMVDESLFLGFGDLRNVIRGKFGPEEEEGLVQALRKSERTTRLASFTSRFPDKSGKDIIEEHGKWPLEEFVCLLAVALETSAESALIDREACNGAVRASKMQGANDATALVARFAPGLGDDAKARVVSFLEKVWED
jgi:hypothetical protein